jgi:hypothetical protein
MNFVDAFFLFFLLSSKFILFSQISLVQRNQTSFLKLDSFKTLPIKKTERIIITEYYLVNYTNIETY